MRCPHVRCASKVIGMDVTFRPTCLSDQLKSATVASTPAEVIRTSQSLSTWTSEVGAILVHFSRNKSEKYSYLLLFFLSCLCWFVLCLPAAKGYLSVRLDESKIYSAVNASGSCLEANVSYSPVIQRCVWETPDNTLVKCTLQNWVTNSNRYTVPSEVNVSKLDFFFFIWQIHYYGFFFLV